MSFSSDQPLVVNQVPQTITLPPLSKAELFIGKVEDYLKDHAETLNGKEGGLYSQQETYSSQQYFTAGDPQTFRFPYRKCLDFVELNNDVNIGASASIDFAHNITGVFESALIYANCTSTDGRRFSTMGPDIYVDTNRAYFTNPYTVALSQVDMIINVLKN